MTTIATVLAAPFAMIIVAVITGAFNRNTFVSSLRRDEDEKRGRRIATLEDRIDALETNHRAELREQEDRYLGMLDAERTQRRRCEAAIYGLRSQVLVLRGALSRAGIDIPDLPDVADYT